MLPELFLKRMEETLGAEYGDFLESLNQERFQALRWNPLKISDKQSGADRESLSISAVHGKAEFEPGSAEELKSDYAEFFKTLGEKAGFHLEQVPWEENGYYYQSIDQPGKHPYHAAGLYYIQEPSAMLPVPLLEVHPGEHVLDLCAAPGGKSTQIAAAMKGQGLLISNEIHPARAKILSENIERMGVRNACVTNESPAHLAENFPEYFDKILVDAPCSGEGMFRKNEEACEEWSPENVALCAARQDEILDCAAGMLRIGGRLVYSTCTFSKEEDEGSVERFLGRHPEFTCKEQMRLWPHKVKGEGHFAAVLIKGEEIRRDYPSKAASGGQNISGQQGKIPKGLEEYAAFVEDNLKGAMKETLMRSFFRNPQVSEEFYAARYLQFGDNLYLAPGGLPSIKGLKVLRPGLHLGTIKKNRFEPSHALALTLSSNEVQHVWNMDAADKEVLAYLNGQTFAAQGEKGWYLICVDGFSIGWGKLAGGIMKNHYPKGLRVNF